MLFSQGDHGWHTKIDIVQPEDGSARSKYVSKDAYYAFRLHPRPMEPSDLFRGGRLFQQYIVDAWASIEQSELNWIRHNQKTIRADLYDGLRDALRGVQGVDLRQMGKRIVLPASHPGMHPSYVSAVSRLHGHRSTLRKARHLSHHDSQSQLGRDPRQSVPYEPDDDDPDQREKQQTASDRPRHRGPCIRSENQGYAQDIKDGVLENVQGYVFTIEFQSVGLPHIHLLIFLRGTLQDPRCRSR